MQPHAVDMVPPEKEVYQAPEIVRVGPAATLTTGMGGDSKDMDGWTIPVQRLAEDD